MYRRLTPEGVDISWRGLLADDAAICWMNAELTPVTHHVTIDVTIDIYGRLRPSYYRPRL